MGKKFSRLKRAIKANNGPFVEGDLKKFSDYFANNPDLYDFAEDYPLLIPIKIRSFYSGYIYEVKIAKTAIDNANDLIDLDKLNWINGEAIVNDQFIPAKIIISKIGDRITKTSKITGWDYSTKIQGRYTYPIGRSTNGNEEMAKTIETVVNSAKQKNSNSSINIEPERWI